MKSLIYRYALSSLFDKKNFPELVQTFRYQFSSIGELNSARF